MAGPLLNGQDYKAHYPQPVPTRASQEQSYFVGGVPKSSFCKNPPTETAAKTGPPPPPPSLSAPGKRGGGRGQGGVLGNPRAGGEEADRFHPRPPARRLSATRTGGARRTDGQFAQPRGHKSKRGRDQRGAEGGGLAGAAIWRRPDLPPTPDLPPPRPRLPNSGSLCLPFFHHSTPRPLFLH